MSQENESQVSRVARMPKPDNYEALVAAFRSLGPCWPGYDAQKDLPTQMQKAEKMADALSPPKLEQPKPELPQVASGGSYL